MPLSSLRLSRRHRWWLAVTSLGLFFTGAVWQGLHGFAQRETEFASPRSVAETWLLKLHGAAAMIFLVLLGTLIPLHLRRGWVARRNRPSGIFFTSVCAWLIATGYALYYVGNEQLRSAASLGHLAVGLASPALLLLHIWAGRRSRSE